MVKRQMMNFPRHAQRWRKRVIPLMISRIKNKIPKAEPCHLSTHGFLWSRIWQWLLVNHYLSNTIYCMFWSMVDPPNLYVHKGAKFDTVLYQEEYRRQINGSLKLWFSPLLWKLTDFYLIYDTCLRKGMQSRLFLFYIRTLVWFHVYKRKNLVCCQII